MTGQSVLDADLERIFVRLQPLWPRLAGKTLFITGGTGFIGRWLLESLALAKRRLGLDTRVVMLSRDPAAFAAKAPHLAAMPGLAMRAGDVLSLGSGDEHFDYVLHAATDASADLNLNNPLKMFDTVVEGTRRTLAYAAAAQARMLFFSSGAVYGAQPAEVSHVREDWRGAPDCTEAKNAYAEAKRAAEMLCAIHARQFGLDVVTARIFALLGPMLSLDIHFAAGNFIRDALAGRTIRVEGAGTAVRSYLYAADLTVWLWTALLAAAPGAVFNMGSEEAVSIAELAERTARLLGGAGYEILGRPDPGWNPGRYVPSNALIRGTLGVSAETGLDDAIRRTAAWNGWTR